MPLRLGACPPCQVAAGLVSPSITIEIYHICRVLNIFRGRLLNTVLIYLAILIANLEIRQLFHVSRFLSRILTHLDHLNIHSE